MSVSKLPLKCAAVSLYSVVKQWLRCNTGKVYTVGTRLTNIIRSKTMFANRIVRYPNTNLPLIFMGNRLICSQGSNMKETNYSIQFLSAFVYYKINTVLHINQSWAFSFVGR
jgi:hypothetical protein